MEYIYYLIDDCVFDLSALYSHIFISLSAANKKYSNVIFEIKNYLNLIHYKHIHRFHRLRSLQYSDQLFYPTSLNLMTNLEKLKINNYDQKLSNVTYSNLIKLTKIEYTDSQIQVDYSIWSTLTKLQHIPLTENNCFPAKPHVSKLFYFPSLKSINLRNFRPVDNLLELTYFTNLQKLSLFDIENRINMFACETLLHVLSKIYYLKYSYCKSIIENNRTITKIICTNSHLDVHRCFDLKILHIFNRSKINIFNCYKLENMRIQSTNELNFYNIDMRNLTKLVIYNSATALNIFKRNLNNLQVLVYGNRDKDEIDTLNMYPNLTKLITYSVIKDDLTSYLMRLKFLHMFPKGNNFDRLIHLEKLILSNVGNNNISICTTLTCLKLYEATCIPNLFHMIHLKYFYFKFRRDVIDKKLHDWQHITSMTNLQKLAIVNGFYPDDLSYLQNLVGLKKLTISMYSNIQQYNIYDANILSGLTRLNKFKTNGIVTRNVFVLKRLQYLKTHCCDEYDAYMLTNLKYLRKACFPNYSDTFRELKKLKYFERLQIKLP